MKAVDALFYLLFFRCFTITFCLNNGLALTPPMGWISWGRFLCNTDCVSDRNNCISERLFMEMADKLIEDGYKDAGYEYVNVDDCWMAPNRDKGGNMFPNRRRFPHGMKFLADYVHRRGLKLGIYQNFGFTTCAGYSGIIGHMEQDAEAFASWEVDMVKLDGCNSEPFEMDDGFVTMGSHLNKTKRPMLYSCSWPYYQLVLGMIPDYKLIAKHCNMWRNFHDISDYWPSILETIDFFGDEQEVLTRHTGPGHWSDPDMLMIGNFGLTPGQARAQMAVWSILPAPLLMSNDLRDMKPEFKHILLNAKVISINQDPLGLPGKRIFQRNNLEIWRRPISSYKSKKNSFAILFLNRHNTTDKEAKVLLKELDLDNKNGYAISSVFSDDNYGLLHPNQTLIVSIKSMDVVMLNCQAMIK